LSVGSNEFGCIGDGPKKDFLKIKQIYFENIFIADICCGYHHCLAISNEGEIFSWGSSNDGQLGNGKSGDNLKQLNPLKI
jgi:alpha-tubulin suppressor-like RCC1 family protein